MEPSMPSPFPGMDPWLEHPALWPDVHNRLIAAIGDALTPLVRPRYFAAIEERLYKDESADLALVGRADVAIVGRGGESTRPAAAASAAAVLDVEVPVVEEVRETYLELRTVDGGDVVTVIEVLSPKNKRPGGDGRTAYLDKRQAIFHSSTSLVEIDLLRGGARMPLRGNRVVASDYAVMVFRSWNWPRAQLYAFSVKDAVPAVPIPLRRGEDEPTLELGAVLGQLYDRAGYDLRIDYGKPPEPPLDEDAAAWAAARLRS